MPPPAVGMNLANDQRTGPLAMARSSFAPHRVVVEAQALLHAADGRRERGDRSSVFNDREHGTPMAVTLRRSGRGRCPSDRARPRTRVGHDCSTVPSGTHDLRPRFYS